MKLQVPWQFAICHSSSPVQAVSMSNLIRILVLQPEISFVIKQLKIHQKLYTDFRLYKHQILGFSCYMGKLLWSQIDFHIMKSFWFKVFLLIWADLGCKNAAQISGSQCSLISKEQLISSQWDMFVVLTCFPQFKNSWPIKIEVSIILKQRIWVRSILGFVSHSPYGVSAAVRDDEVTSFGTIHIWRPLREGGTPKAD